MERNITYTILLLTLVYIPLFMKKKYYREIIKSSIMYFYLCSIKVIHSFKTLNFSNKISNLVGAHSFR